MHLPTDFYSTLVILIVSTSLSLSQGGRALRQNERLQHNRLGVAGATAGFKSGHTVAKSNRSQVYKRYFRFIADESV
uniref:Putative secreted protein n=1 Tax=Anopheles triannulatus TaxID=58253 RepID=A0A2M4B0E0_9DIPT